jgi:sugar-phosphatase
LAASHFDASAILFDLDGVLVDTMPSIRAAWTRWALDRNLSPTDVLASIHMTGVELVRRFAPDVDPLAEVRRISAGQASSERGLARFDGSLELLEQLPAERWAIVTSARLEPAMRHLAMAGLPAPRVLITAELTPRGKPDPSGYRLGADRLGFPPGECVAIEDSPAGLRAARDAGMFAVGVTNTHSASELDGAHVVIASLRELEVLLDPGQDIGRVRVRRKHRVEDLHDPA